MVNANFREPIDRDVNGIFHKSIDDRPTRWHCFFDELRE